ncbi:hypothetical protein BO71DRAFT_445022 [Aspergillus ellipticus CBS 707.79]|uniref:BZIP domain-containing protein n=1 Tax=Aspergillus ellipticus CBS 707.79 TaxID=1448320 RepID=A0A319CVG6_9EURO|nr:hypothetical protein BO71DRAFT_445022 [Aspergillus ellipticus CBS 707.79]
MGRYKIWDPALSIQEWQSQELPPCTPSARPPPSSTRSGRSQPSFDCHNPDPFLLHPDFSSTPHLDFGLDFGLDFDLALASSAAFPPADPFRPHALFFYESPPDTTFPGSAASSRYPDPLLGYPDLSCAPFPLPGSDTDAIASLLSSPDDPSESLNLFPSPGVQSVPEPSDYLPSPPQMPAGGSATSPSVNLPPPNSSSNRVKKRELNTQAARRYRQRRVDRMNELEAELEAIKRERDELKMRVSKLEGETDALRSMVKAQDQ